MTLRIRLSTVIILLVLCAGPAWAQGQPPSGSDGRDNAATMVAQPDFALAALPTTGRVPAGQWAFRMTHRFARPIAGTCPDTGPRPDGCGGVGAFVENFFGFDSASQVGIELRYGVRPGTQLAVHRTNNRAIQLLGQHALLRADSGLAVDVVTAFEGQNNFREQHTVTVGAVVARVFSARGAIYAQPLLLFNSNPLPDTMTNDNHTVMLGLGGRVRLGRTTYLVAEAAPRLAGFKPGVDHISLAVERRAGGHMFQLNVSNSFASTLRQLAHGGPNNGDWYIGFNLSRRFY